MEIEKIGPKIREFRKKRKLTQEDLAKSLGYSGKWAIAHIEKGDADMTYEKMLLLLRTYMVDANELFEVERIDKLIKEYKDTPKHEKVVVYIHGLNGSAEESKDYSYIEGYDIKGLDYEDANPWELKDSIRDKFIELIKPYEEVVVIANSIGAFYAYQYLSDIKINHAFFISPIADMNQLIINIMMDNHIDYTTLKKEKYIKLDNGQTLSYDFVQYLETNKDKWDIPTDILYGSHDDIVYIENIADFLKGHPKTRLTINGEAGHYMHTKKEKEFIKNWILNVLNG